MTNHAVAIIGAGLGGIGAALGLKRDGIASFVVFEKANGIGGTWRDNRVPGLLLRRTSRSLLVLAGSRPARRAAAVEQCLPAPGRDPHKPRRSRKASWRTRALHVRHRGNGGHVDRVTVAARDQRR